MCQKSALTARSSARGAPRGAGLRTKGRAGKRARIFCRLPTFVMLCHPISDHADQRRVVH